MKDAPAKLIFIPRSSVGIRDSRFHSMVRIDRHTNVDIWTVKQAKARFCALIERAHTYGPQAITRYGRQIAVVVDAAEWHCRIQRSGSLADFFKASPLRRSGLKVRRSKARMRSTGS